MNRNRKSIIAACAAAVTLLIAPAAFATNTLSVAGTTSPAGNVAVTAAVTAAGVSFVTDFGIPTSCTASTISGTVSRGASVTAGSTIGKIDNLTFGSCVWDGVYPVVIEKSTNSGAPASWPIEVVTTPAKGATLVNIKIKNVTAKMHTTGSIPWACSLEAVGDVTGTFNQSTQQIAINTGTAFPLAITALISNGSKTPSTVGTCGGSIYTGDKASMTGTFGLTTPGVGGIHF